jgi:hydroxymethylglutaryl-CoA lyase
MIRIIETPRDAFQSIARFIPTQAKITYINALLRAGFDTVEVGSFVSPKAIPQLADTAQVLEGLDLSATKSRIMVLAANKKGVEQACGFEAVNDISYPFSASPTFIHKNIGKTQIEALLEIEECRALCEKHDKRLLVYITMAFGNPYGDEWSLDLLMDWVSTLAELGLTCIPLSDITAEADAHRIRATFTGLLQNFPDITFGLHLHSEKETALEKVTAAYEAGCRRFDSVLGGVGGCPMTGKEMIANHDTGVLLHYFQQQGICKEISVEAIAPPF